MWQIEWESKTWNFLTCSTVAGSRRSGKRKVACINWAKKEKETENPPCQFSLSMSLTYYLPENPYDKVGEILRHLRTRSCFQLRNIVKLPHLNRNFFSIITFQKKKSNPDEPHQALPKHKSLPWFQQILSGYQQRNTNYIKSISWAYESHTWLRSLL